MREAGLVGPDERAELALTRAIVDAIQSLPPRDASAAEVLFGLAEGSAGERLGKRREGAAAHLSVTAGTFRNSHESRLIAEVSRRIAAGRHLSVHENAAGVPVASEEALGFWSYVHEDNAGDGGRILDLAGDLETHYRMQTAEDLVLFVDRKSSRWGEKWVQLISEAIAGTTFFIPIITPSYFRSNSCRRELLKFVREADKAGLQRLLMPVYWITVPALESEGIHSNDEAIRAIARHQWRDLREVRLEDQRSSVYRKAVSGLAGEIAMRAAEVAASVQDLPRPVDSLTAEPFDASEGEPGFLELLADGDDAVEAITTLMNLLSTDIQTVGTMASDAAGELRSAAEKGQGTKRALVITERFAHNLSPLAKQMEERGQEFTRLLSMLDSGTQIRLGLLEASESPLDDQQVGYLVEIEEVAGSADEAVNALEELVSSIDPIAEMSRSLRAPARKMRSGLQGIIDGRALMNEWGVRARRIRRSTASD